jgi:hypothetical protein
MNNNNDETTVIFSTGEVTASVENESDQQDLQNCMNEAAFSNCNAEDYINIDKDVQTRTRHNGYRCINTEF